MPDQTPHRRGRRDPQLAAQLQPGPDGPETDEEPEDQGGFEQQLPDLLHEGETFSLKVSMPIILAGSARETYITAEFMGSQQPDEHWADASARGRAFLLYNIGEQIEEAEELIRQYEEQQAAKLAAAGVTPR